MVYAGGPTAVEQTRQARLAQSQALSQRAQFATNRPPESFGWQPAGTPEPGASGALAARPIAEGYIPNYAPSLPPVIPPPEELEEEPEAGFAEVEEPPVFDEADAARQLGDSQLRASISAERDRLASEAMDKAKKEAIDAAKKAATKAAKKYFPKLVNWFGLGADGTSATADASDMGMSLVATIFVYLATFTWYNVSMIYGYYLSGYFQTGKEDPLIPPLTWENFNLFGDGTTIPLPDMFLHAALIALDIMLLILVLIALGLGLLLLYVAASLIEDTYGTIFGMVTGTGEFGFLGDIFSDWISL
jgi:hypothetical protein